MPGKTSPGQRCEGRIRVQTNVFGIKPLEDVPFFRYDFRVLEEYPSKKQDEPVFKEVTKQTRNEYAFKLFLCEVTTLWKVKIVSAFDCLLQLCINRKEE